MKPLRIATLNCLNLALPARRFYAGVDPYSPDEYIAKTQWLAQMLDRLAADFVLVQEVFHEQALSDVVHQAGNARGWSLAVPLAAQDNDKPRLGLIWRQPWQPKLESIADFAEGCAVPVPDAGTHASFSRPLLRAEVVLPDYRGSTLTLLNVHLKSRRPDFADGEGRDDPVAEARAQLRSLIRRGAEAAALRKMVIESTRRSRAPLVVAGDFNDDANAVTTQIVADTSWKREDRPQRDFMLFNALDVEQRPSPGRGRDVAFTTLFGGEPERIDHVLVSEEFVAPSKHAIGQVTAVEIYSDHLLERRRGAETGIRLDRIYSDHAAVCVTLQPLA
jgi:endonuclease/exonuclease/phosphatase family metal-dependent hydrolase